MKIQVSVIEILALFAVVAFMLWQSQPALNTKTRRLTPPIANWSAEQRAEEIRKLATPLWKELLMSGNWEQTIRNRQRVRSSRILAVWAEGTDSKQFHPSIS
jgi:hypothetical protein